MISERVKINLKGENKMKITAAYLKKLVKEETKKITEGVNQPYDVPGHGTWYYVGDNHGNEIYSSNVKGAGGKQISVSMATPGSSTEEKIAFVLDGPARMQKIKDERAAEKAAYEAEYQKQSDARRAKEMEEIKARTEAYRQSVESGEPMMYDEEDFGGRAGKMSARIAVDTIAGGSAKYSGWENQPAKRKVNALKAQMKNYSRPDDQALFKDKIKELGGGFLSRFGLGESKKITTSYLKKLIKEEIQKMK
tara:strand:- start:5986 stop:6738 length:753 start_codon:yes stop_codon:yes gene_type:complete